MSEQAITDADVQQILQAAAVLTALSELMSQDAGGEPDPSRHEYADGLARCADHLRACVGQHGFSADGHWRATGSNEHVIQLARWHAATH